MIADLVNKWHDVITFALLLAVSNMAALVIIGWKRKR